MTGQDSSDWLGLSGRVCVVTGGALAPDNRRWIPTARRACLCPVTALSRVFRSRYLAALQEV